jgi:hypothetical protein
MNCEQVQERLELLFGSHDLPDELSEHLRDCAICEACQNELADLEQQLGSDDDFVLSEDDLNFAVRAVERRTNRSTDSNNTSPTWLQPVLRVAAVLLVAIAFYGTYQFGLRQDATDLSDTAAAVNSNGGSIMSFYLDNDEVEIDETMITVLIDNYSDGYLESGEVLLGDITAEELEYLLDNFEIGELL